MFVQPSHFFILASFVALGGTIAAIALQPPAAGLQPTRVTLQQPKGTLGEVAVELSRASGMPIAVPPASAKTNCPVNFTQTPIWVALEQVARETGMKIVLHERGKRLALEPRGLSREAAAVSGPFRVVATQVVARSLLDLGVTSYEVNLEVNWEPRIAVFRIDSQPRVTRAIDDRGTALAAAASTVSAYPADAQTEMKVKLTGLTRESRSIAVLAGEFRATAADKMLVFNFNALNGKLSQSKTQDRVTATLKSIAKPEKTWEIDIEVVYPEGHPIFESFEEQKWLRDNKVQLVPPPGAGRIAEPESEEVSAHGRRIIATYRFPGNLTPLAKGWSLVYETPSPLVEVKVPFELKGIPLP